MSELTLMLLRLGFLVLMWAFVLGIVAVLRTDLFGARVVPRASRGRRPGAARPPHREARPARPGRSVPRSLVVTEGSLAGTTISLSTAPVLIGRSPECSLVLTDDYASTRHARLYPRDGRWYVEDLGSTNGTLLGRTRLTEATPVAVGSRLRIGRTVLELRR